MSSEPSSDTPNMNNINAASYQDEKIKKRNRIRKNFHYLLSQTPAARARKAMSLEHMFGDVSLALAMMQKCSPFIYASFSAWLKVCPPEWMTSFLEHDGLSLMLNALTFPISGRKDLTKALSDLMVTQCLKRVLNTETGMKYLIEGEYKKTRILY